MELHFLHADHNPSVVIISIVIAAFASYVSLRLAMRVQDREHRSQLCWMGGGAFIMGSGIWSMHFVGMLAMTLPIGELGYDPLLTFLSWLVGVIASGLAMVVATYRELSRRVLLQGALFMGGGICAMHYIGMAAISLSKPIIWDASLVALSWLVACTASAGALKLFFQMRSQSGIKGFFARVASALCMGFAISGMHYIGTAAANFPADTMILANAGIGSDNLRIIVTAACIILLSISLVVSALDAHMQEQATSLLNLRLLSAQLQEANTELRRRVSKDSLTNVANRTLFQEQLERALDGTKRGNLKKLAVLFIDLDGFKPINDCYGHGTGDIVLQKVARRLETLCAGQDTLARIGGDEFVVLLTGIRGEDDVRLFIERVHTLLNAPFEAEGRCLLLSCSIGAVIYPDYSHRDTLVVDADAAMYHAKRAGGGTYAFFRSYMHKNASEQVDLRQALNEALETRALELHYQPKVRASDGRIHSVEALLRWTHPSKGAIAPEVFIPIAEHSGMILHIGAWVIDEACRQIAAWRRLGITWSVAINLSGYQLRQDDIFHVVQEALQRHGVSPRDLICEITESIAMDDVLVTKRVLTKMSAIGVQLSIDDFGTGYSSLSTLRQLQVDELKVDRQFVQDIAGSQEARAILEVIVQLAHALNLRVVAEGVETREQEDILLGLGCDELQGFYLGRPMQAQVLQGMPLIRQLRTASLAVSL